MNSFPIRRYLCFVSFFILVLSLFDAAHAQNSQSSGINFNHNTTGFVLDGAHIRVTCDSCHTQGQFRGTPRDCATCHRSGDRAPGKPASHVPTTANCDLCHRTASWSPSTFQHSIAQGVLVASCGNCHNGTNATGKSATHLPTSLACDSCHKTSAWLPAGYSHALVVAGSCATCHNGVRATGKTASHMPTTASCDACHTAGVAFSPMSVSVSAMHANTVGPVAAGNCSTCHNGSMASQNAQSKPSTHVVTTSQCDSCHKSTSTWATAAKPDHASIMPPVAGRCSNCHDNVSAIGKPINHIPTTGQCDTCHSYVGAFKPAQMNHVGTAGQCISCHNGSFGFANALAKSTIHVPTTSQCDTCHSSGYSAWAPGVMNHAASTGPQTAGNCATCHSGAFVSMNAQVKPATHVNTSAQCDTCHKSTTSWATASFAHDASTIGNCSNCHNNVAATGKPPSHIPTTAQCSACHNNYISFRPAVMAHIGTSGPVAVGNCSTCHNGNYAVVNALAKPAAHIPTTSQCDTCHTLGYTAWSPSVMNHAGMAGQCSLCHGGAYVSQNAQTKTATHVATTAQCDTCHSSTTSWGNASFNHTAATPPVAGRCATCHNGTAALGKPTNHIPTTAQCDVCHSNFTAFNPGVMSHTGTTGPVAAGNCISCHSGTYIAVNAQAKGVTHIATTQSCDVCHTTAAWTPVSFSHTGVLPGTCATCHNGTTALGKPANHIPTTAQCDACHSNFTAFAPGVMNHSATSGPLAAGNCATCHSGTFVSVNAQVKPATHVSTTAQCDTCHNSTTSWATAAFAHDASAIGNCSTCHNNVSATGKPTTHIPTTAQCSVCHNNYSTFKPAVMSHTGTSGPLAVGNCSTCHNGTYAVVNALAKGSTHIPTISQCDTCHTGYTVWSPAVMNHTGLSGQCSTCHGGAYVSENAQTKTATHVVTTAQCDTCHSSTTSWATAAFNHATASPPVAGRCATCHNGTLALGKPTNHVPTTAQCDVCHANFTAFNPGVMSHTGTTGPVAAGNCITCHSGTYTAINAQAKSATHIPTTQSCDVCHTTVAWNPTSFSHAGVVAGTCATCHNNVNATGQSTPHIATTQSCDICHRTGLSWLPLITPYAHTGVATTGCANCHGGAFPNIDVKPATHLPTLLGCENCHASFSSWLPVKFNHTGVATGTCQTCHGGSYTSITAKPANHIPTTTPAGMPGNECSLCHSSTTSFVVERMNHGSVQTSCATCHDSSVTYLGNMSKINRAQHHGAGTKDCSSSGCHKPLGSRGQPYSSWD